LQFLISKKLILFYFFLLVFFSSFKFSSEINSPQQLGEKLFFDPILSSDFSVSCASCHKPKYGFADNVAFSKGVNGKLTKRNVPSVMNVALRSVFFLDGRASTLEEQAKGPIENPDEMNLPIDSAIKRLNSNDEYKALFNKIYNENPNENDLLNAISAYEKTLETQDSEFDLAVKNNNISTEIEKGRKIFVGKGNCFDCHNGIDFTDDDFHNIGLFNGKDLNDSGRAVISKNKVDIGKFKTPGLRNVGVTSPYMHNGKFNSLEEVVDYYNDPFKQMPNAVNRDSLIKPLGLNSDEKLALVAFLKALTDKRFEKK
jgi:cytochrome c peroxidase